MSEPIRLPAHMLLRHAYELAIDVGGVWPDRVSHADADCNLGRDDELAQDLVGYAADLLAGAPSPNHYRLAGLFASAAADLMEHPR